MAKTTQCPQCLKYKTSLCPTVAKEAAIYEVDLTENNPIIIKCNKFDKVQFEKIFTCNNCGDFPCEITVRAKLFIGKPALCIYEGNANWEEKTLRNDN